MYCGNEISAQKVENMRMCRTLLLVTSISCASLDSGVVRGGLLFSWQMNRIITQYIKLKLTKKKESAQSLKNE